LSNGGSIDPKPIRVEPFDARECGATSTVCKTLPGIVDPTEIDEAMLATPLTPNVADVTIQRLDPTSWRDYKLLRLEALATDPQAFEASYDELRAKPDTYWMERLQDVAEGGGSWLLFATRGQRPVGMIGASVTEEQHIANISAVFVAEEARGWGVGTNLMSAMLREVRQDRSIQRLRLYVNASQKTAVHLYDRFGFLIVDFDRARYGDGQEYDGYVMERAVA
jgi:ribosomal protein S18 acetylase RimI-like enzyme